MKNLFTFLIRMCVIFLFTYSSLYADEPLSTPFFEGFESEDVFETWTVLDANEDGTVGEYATSGIWHRSTALKMNGNAAAAYRFTSNNADDWMFTPAIRLEKGKEYELKWGDYSSASYEEKYAVYIGTEKTPAKQTMIGGERVVKTGLWNERSEKFTVATTGTYYISWYCHSDKNKATMYIDDIRLEEINPIDMKAIEIKGLNEVTVGAEAIHRVVVMNNGTEAIAAFSVSLYDEDDKQLASVNYSGETLASFESKEVEINWTPTSNMEGEYTIKAVVSAVGDPVAANNSTAFQLFVYPFATYQVHVADFDDTKTIALLPINLTSKNSGSQVIYYENEINNYGYINAIKYYAQFGSSGIDKQNVKIYIAVTDRESMEGQWSITGNTLVYEGDVNFPAGSFSSIFEFTEPFLYTGGNLLVTVIRSGETAYGKYFLYSDAMSKPNRSRHAIDYNNPFDFSQTGTLNIHCPNTSFLMQCDGGSISGTILSGSDAPVEGVIVKMTCTDEGKESEYEVLSDENGKYIFKFVPSGNYNITTNKTGFTGSASTTEVSYLTSRTIDFNIQSLNQYALKGKVVNSNGKALANASVILSGEDIFFVTTDSEGQFEIDGVYGSRTYELRIAAGNHLEHSSEIIFEEEDLVLNEIKLSSCTETQAPQDLVAGMNQEEWYQVDLSWKAPTGTSVAGYRIYRDGTLLNQLELIAATTYSETVAIGEYTYQVIAVSENNCVSLPAEVVVEMLQNPCEIAVNTFPYIETFESGAIPACWEQEFLAGITPWVVADENGEENPAPFNGNYNAKIFTMQVGTITQLIMPTMDITGLEKPTLSFHMFHTNFGISFDELIVYYRTSEESEWLELGKYINPMTQWTEKNISLPNPSANYSIAFEAIVNYGRGILLDDIKVVDANTCAPINDLAFEQIAERKVELSWYAPHSIGMSQYKIYRDNQLIETIEALNYHTVYTDVNVDLGEHKYQVIAVYADNDNCSESEPVEKTFTTVGQCDPISDLVLEQKGTNTVGLSWKAPNAKNIVSYSIVRNGNIIKTTKETEYVDNEVENGEIEYCVEVSYSGKACETSDAVCSTIFSICDPVINLTGTFNSKESTIDLKWDINAETDNSVAIFEVYRDGELVSSTDKLLFIDWFIELGQSYNYCIVPTYINKCEGSSSCIDVETECAAPTSLAVTMTQNADNCSAELNWDFDPRKAYESLPVKAIDLGSPAKDKFVSADNIQASDLIPSGIDRSLYAAMQQFTAKADEENLVYTSGPYITHTGEGHEGTDISVVEDDFGVFGYYAIAGQGLFVGEDFVLEETTHISEMEFFSYVTQEDLPISKITSIRIIILKGHPFLENGQSVWGDLNKDILSETSFTGVYRVPASNLQNPYRPIMNVKAKIDYTLPAGKYWMLFTLIADAPEESGPSMVPVTIPGVKNTGNAIQYSDAGFWREIRDPKNYETAGIAFNVFGSPVADKFNVYRDEQLIASNLEETTYLDIDVPRGKHTWEVTHLCGDGESDSTTAEDTCTPTAIEDIDSDTTVAVYPNPTKDQVTVRANGIEKVEIYNLAGILLRSLEVNGTASELTIGMKEYGSGTYMVVVHTSDNYRTSKQVIVID